MKPLHNAVAVKRFQGADLEDEHVKRSLKKLSVAGFVLPRHSSYEDNHEDNHGMPRMSRQAETQAGGDTVGGSK